MSIDLGRNFFELFGLEASFAIDAGRLDAAYRELQARVHPDRYVHLPEVERRLSMQWATHVNEGYRTLKQPLDRARYLLHLRGVDVAQESNTAMPAQFLMEQMEWREAAADARAAEDRGALEQLHLRLRGEADKLYAQVETDLDRQQNFAGAADAVRRLMFVLKLRDEIDESLETLET